MSKLYIATKNINGKTIIADSFFTSPIKIAKPFYYNDFTKIIMMTASAGMLDGDYYDIKIDIGEKSAVEFTAQSYTKVFKAEKDGVKQDVEINMAEDSFLFYKPCPLIPFGGSKYNGYTKINLVDNCKFAMIDIISCGRIAMGEKFQFENYISKIEVRKNEKLVFLDYNRLFPKEIDLSGLGFFEGFTHQGIIYSYNLKINEDFKNDYVDIAITDCVEGKLIRIFGNSADDIIKVTENLFL